MTRRKFAVLLAAIFVLALFTVGIHHSPWMLRRVQVLLLQRRAEDALRRNAPSEAKLALRQAAALDPTDSATIRLWVRHVDPTDSAEELHWRSLLADIEPADRANQLEMARIALPLAQIQDGLRALAALQSAGADRPDYLHLLSLYAAGRGDMASALQAATRACATDPSSPEYRLNLGRLLVRDPAPKRRAQGQEILTQLATTDTTRTRALSTLRDAARLEGDWRRASSFSLSILESPEAGFHDRLAHLDILTGLDDRETYDLLQQIRTEALDSPVRLAEFCDWTLARGRASEMFSWLQSLPTRRRQASHIQLALARTLLAAESWQKIVENFATVLWPEQDHLRLAAVARAKRKLEPFSSFDWEMPWRTAFDGALRTPADARALAQFMATWPDWGTERADLLWHIEQTFSQEADWALHELQMLYQTTSNTLGLQRVARHAMQRPGSSDESSNNWAYYSLLFQDPLPEAYTVAEQLHRRRPDDPIVTSTLALALYRQRKTADALRQLQRLPPDTLALPAVAPLHAAVLTDTGNLDAARDALRHIGDNVLLPEETALAQHARERIARLAASFRQPAPDDRPPPSNPAPSREPPPPLP